MNTPDIKIEPEERAADVILSELDIVYGRLREARRRLLIKVAIIDKLLRAYGKSDEDVKVVTLKEAVFIALKNGPLNKDGILAGVMKAGYKFTTRKPMLSINSILYTRRHGIRKLDGNRFALPTDIT